MVGVRTILGSTWPENMGFLCEKEGFGSCQDDDHGMEGYILGHNIFRQTRMRALTNPKLAVCFAHILGFIANC